MLEANASSNSSNAATELSPNEIIFGFKVLKSLNLLADPNITSRANDTDSPTTLKDERAVLRKEAEEAIAFANASMKIRYDFTRKPLNLKIEDHVYVKLHKDYTQSRITNRKYSKQRLEPVKALEQIGKLAYKLDIPTT
jgi:hypothetical protein